LSSGIYSAAAAAAASNQAAIRGWIKISIIKKP